MSIDGKDQMGPLRGCDFDHSTDLSDSRVQKGKRVLESIPEGADRLCHGLKPNRGGRPNGGLLDSLHSLWRLLMARC